MVVGVLSSITGIGENALRLLLSVLLGYPIAYVYKLRFLGTIPGVSEVDAIHIRNNYIAITGLTVAFFFNGWDIVHSLVTIAGTYALCVVFGNILNNRFMAACLIFIFNLTYLISGYYAHKDVDYDLTWTMPQCVLCLRMIGFGMDFYDGLDNTQKTKESENLKPGITKPTEKQDENKVNDASSSAKILSKPKPKAPVSFSGVTALSELPGFFQFIGYAYFFSAFMVGPQFSFALYKKFIENKTLVPNQKGEKPTGAGHESLRCFIKGVFYLGLQQILDGYFPPSYLFTSAYAHSSFLNRIFVVWLTGRTMINKYLGIWTLNEGACVLAGISFNGYDSEGKAEWNGLTNIDTYAFETATSLDQIITCFNINTNFWIKQYIFKRLRFLNSKEASQLGSLFFLALWHGFHTGYFACFVLEFFDTFVEKRLTKAVSPYTAKFYQDKSPLRYLINFACYLYTSFALLYAIMSFGLLRLPLYHQIYSSIYYIGHIGLVFFGIVSYLIPSILRKPKVGSVKKTQ